jgi:hypothetical protein
MLRMTVLERAPPLYSVEKFRVGFTRRQRYKVAKPFKPLA